MIDLHRFLSAVAIPLFFLVLYLSGCAQLSADVGKLSSDAAKSATKDIVTTDADNATGTTIPQQWRSYENSYFGIRFHYPDDIFDLNDGGESIILASDIKVTDDPFGESKAGSSGTYTMRFDISSQDIVGTATNLIPEIAKTMFPDGTEASFNRTSKTEMMLIDGLTSYSYTSDEQGVHRCRIFVPRKNGETLVITYDFGTSKKLTDRTQEEIFKVITRSLASM